jgi:hypothetical protein
MRRGSPGSVSSGSRTLSTIPGELVVGDGGAVDEEVVVDKRGRQADELGQR